MTHATVPGSWPAEPPSRSAAKSRRRTLGYPPNFAVINPAYVDDLSSAQLREIAETLRTGGVVLFMSDCAYAVGADPRSAAGIAALDALLDHRGQPIPLSVADAALASKVIRFHPVVIRLSGFWPWPRLAHQTGQPVRSPPGPHAARTRWAGRACQSVRHRTSDQR